MSGDANSSEWVTLVAADGFRYVIQKRAATGAVQIRDMFEGRCLFALASSRPHSRAHTGALEGIEKATGVIDYGSEFDPPVCKQIQDSFSRCESA